VAQRRHQPLRVRGRGDRRRPFTSLYASHTSVEEIETALADARKDPITTEAWHERADDSVFWATSTITPIYNDAFHGYTVVTQDTTSSKQYERMLERQNDRLKEFTDILSHDLRNPLNIVSGNLTLYRQTGDESHLESIENATNRMQRLIDDLLSVARHGQVIEEPGPVDLGHVVTTASEGTLGEAATLEYEQVPTLMGDYDRLCQLIENLFRNAVEHVDSDVTIRVGPLSTDDSTEFDGFYVEDDGPGIPEDIRDEVFDHGFTTESDGTGFGLSVVRTIVGAHGWDVAVTSGPLGGARFEITGIQFIDT
jgi:signal transduction histidine kinase